MPEDTDLSLGWLLSWLEENQNIMDNAIYSNKSHLKYLKLLTNALGCEEELSSTDAERVLKIFFRYKNDMQCVPYLLEMISILINIDKVKPFKPDVEFVQSALAIIEILKMLSMESVTVTHIRSLAFQVLSAHPINALSKLIQSHRSKIIEIIKLYLTAKQQTLEAKVDSLVLLKLLEVLPPTEKKLFVKEGIRLWLSVVVTNIMEYLVKSDNCEKHEEYVNYLEILAEEMVHLEYFEYPEFHAFVLRICDAKSFPLMIKKLFDSGKNIWYRIWIAVVKLLQHHTTRFTGSKGTPINSLLPIVETAFKRDPMQKVLAFKCWTEVINNFSREKNESCIPKRVKLLLTPLKLNNAKTEEIIAAKFDTWWHLILTYQTRLQDFVNEILVLFIRFAFGTSKLTFWACQVSSLKKKCLEAFVEIFGHCEISEDCCATEIPHLNRKIITLELFINHWDEWFNALKSAIKVGSSLNCPAANANVRCVWKSIMTMLAGIPDVTRRTEYFNEVVKMLTGLVEDCKTDGNLMRLLVESLVLPLFLENIKSLIDTSSQDGSPMIKTILTLIMDSTLDQYYRKLSHEVLMKLLKPIASSLIEKTDQNDAVLFLQDLPQNDCTLKLWMAEVEIMSQNEISVQKLNNLLLWPLNSVGDFSDVMQPASTWYNAFQIASGQLIDIGFHKELAKILGKPITGSAAGFAICAISGVLKHTYDVKLAQKLEELTSQVGDSFLRECSPEIRTEVQKVMSSIEKANAIGNKTINVLSNIEYQETPPKKELNKKKKPNILKTVVENGEEFVVVESIWKFNPKKLTANQMEKFQRKREIPALYQDLSQSQDEIKLAAWKTDSQDTSLSSSKASKAASNNDLSETLKNMSSTDVVPKIMENILTECNKSQQKTSHNLIKTPVTNKKALKTDKLTTPEGTKSPRMALKDRVIRNVKILTHKSSPLSPQNIDKNSQKDQILTHKSSPLSPQNIDKNSQKDLNQIVSIVTNSASTPISTNNNLNCNPKEDVITNNTTPVENTTDAVTVDKQETFFPKVSVEASKTRVLNGADNVENDAPLLSDRPVRVKKTPRKYEDSKLFGLRKRRLSRSYSQTDSNDIQKDVAATVEETHRIKNMNDNSGKNEDHEQEITITEGVKDVKAESNDLHKPPIVSIPDEVMTNIMDCEILVEKATIKLAPVDADILTRSSRRRKSVEKSVNENKVSANKPEPSNDMKPKLQKSSVKEKLPDKEEVSSPAISKTVENDVALEVTVLPLSKRIKASKNRRKSCDSSSPAISKTVENDVSLEVTVLPLSKRIKASKNRRQSCDSSSPAISKTVENDVALEVTVLPLSKRIKASKNRRQSCDSTPLRKNNKNDQVTVTNEVTNDVDEQSLKTNAKIARMEKNLIINMVEGHPARLKRTIIKTSPATNIVTVVESGDGRSSSPIQTNTQEPCSEDVIESSQDSSLTTISTQSTRSKRTSKRPNIVQQPVLVLKKIEVEAILTQNQDTSLDIELPQNKTALTVSNDVDDNSTTPITINVNNVGPETQELAEADTQPNPADFMEVDLRASEPSLETNATANDITQTLVDEIIPFSNIDSTNEVSSPFRGYDKRNQDFLNNTLEISPIKTLSPDTEKKSPSPETSVDFVVITLSSPVNSNGEPLEKSPPSPEFFTEDKVSPDKRDASPPRAKTRTHSTSPSLSLKKNRPQLRSGGRAAQMLGMLGATENKKDVDNECKPDETKKGSTSIPARRNLKTLYNSVSNSADDSTESSSDFLQFKRPLPTVSSSPSGPILKRKLADMIDETSVSPAHKRKRVSFLDPPVSTTVSVHKYIEPISGISSPQSSAVTRQLRTYTRSPKNLSNEFKSHELDLVLSKTVESFNDTEQMSTDDTHTSLDVTPAVEIVKTSELNDTDPIFPDLINCKDPIEAISADLSSPGMKELFVQELVGKVKTVADLAKMTELEVNRLCIKAPKIKVTKKVLMEYESKRTANKLVETVIEEAFSEPLTESLLRTANVEIQTEKVEVNDTEIQTDGEPVSLASTQTDRALTTERDAQTDESGSKSTSDLISCLLEREDFAEKLSDKLDDESKLKIADKLPTASHVDILMAKYDDSTSFDNAQKKDFAEKLSDKLDDESKLKIADKLPTALLIDLLMQKCDNTTSKKLLSTPLDKHNNSSVSDPDNNVDLDCVLKWNLLSVQYLNNLKVAKTKKTDC